MLNFKHFFEIKKYLMKLSFYFERTRFDRVQVIFSFLAHYFGYNLFPNIW